MPEAGSAEAVALIEQPDYLWVAPRLMMTEVAGAISRKVQGRKLPLEVGAQAVNALTKAVEDGFVQLVEDELLTDGAFLLSIELAHLVADCLYLELAARENADLATADMKLASLAAGRGVSVLSVPSQP